MGAEDELKRIADDLSPEQRMFLFSAPDHPWSTRLGDCPSKRDLDLERHNLVDLWCDRARCEAELSALGREMRAYLKQAP